MSQAHTPPQVQCAAGVWGPRQVRQQGSKHCGLSYQLAREHSGFVAGRAAGPFRLWVPPTNPSLLLPLVVRLSPSFYLPTLHTPGPHQGTRCTQSSLLAILFKPSVRLPQGPRAAEVQREAAQLALPVLPFSRPGSPI